MEKNSSTFKSWISEEYMAESRSAPYNLLIHSSSTNQEQQILLNI